MTTPAKRPAEAAYPIHPLIANRWSARAIDPEQPVAEADLLTVLEAARWAPSCFGDEPWRFLVWDRQRDGDAWETAASCLAEGNQLWARKAPVLLAVLADSEFRRNGKPNRWGTYDTGAASENLHLQGVELGLVVHQMGGFDGRRLREHFGVPERFDPMAMIAIGHPGPIEALDEKYRDGERSDRARRPLGELAFHGHWGRAIDGSS